MGAIAPGCEKSERSEKGEALESAGILLSPLQSEPTRAIESHKGSCVDKWSMETAPLQSVPANFRGVGAVGNGKHNNEGPAKRS